jgi:hypothetical protein
MLFNSKRYDTDELLEESEMRRLFGSAAVVFSLALFAATGLADERGRGDGGGGGGSVAAHVDGHADGARANSENRANVEADRANVNAERATDRATATANRAAARGPNIGREYYLDRTAHLGDRSYDKRGIGALDEARYATSRDSNWRYRRWGNEWWYWLPTGTWDYWRDGRWYPYDYDNYVDVYQQNQPIQAANYNGPYYEDQNGFYYLNGNRRVYDPQIRRVAGEVGTLPSGAVR